MSDLPVFSRDVGSGPPVVLLHAFPLSSAMWLEQREALAGDFRLITPDFRGFGGSAQGDAAPSVDVLADDVARLLDDKGVDRAVLCGLSMGGYVTMAMCRRHPDRVRAVVLADTKAAADAEPARANRERIAERVLAEGAGALVEEVLPALVGETTRAERGLVYGRVRALVAAAPPGAAAWAQRAMAARPDSFATLTDLDRPALVIVGEEDTLSPVADAQAMVDALPRGELVVIPRAGHLTAMEQPAAFTDALRAFLTGLDDAAGAG